MPATNQGASTRRYTVTISQSGGTVGPADATWRDIEGGAVQFPVLPVYAGPAKAITGPFGGPTLRELILRRPLKAGRDTAGEPFVAHMTAILDGTMPWSLDIAIDETDRNGTHTYRRLVYRGAYLRKWQIVPLDHTGKDEGLEEFWFVASELEISR